MAWRIGIDIGGTFTDVALVEEAHRPHRVAKLPTTPHDFGQAVIDGIRQALRRATASTRPRSSLLSHATTVVTNALLESKGARAGFVTTRGFRDVLELRRSARADLYDLLPGRAGRAGAAPLALRDHRADRRAGRGGHAARRGRTRRR